MGLPYHFLPAYSEMYFQMFLSVTFFMDEFFHVFNFNFADFVSHY